MMTQPARDFYYPHRMGQIIASATAEIIGGEAARTVLEHAALSQSSAAHAADGPEHKVPFTSISGLQSALDERYGKAGQGLALRIGRACFQEGLQEFGPAAGLTELGFRLLPLNTKLRTGASALAAIFNQYTDQRVTVEQDDEHIYWRIERCPMCWERRSDTSACHLAVGVLQEALYWASNGRLFNVEEIACVACGDPACVIAIDKAPLI
jgi:predicted hydrocarbon binding protein